MNQSKQLAQGAMMVAIFAILVAISFYVPVLSLITMFIAPLPIAYYSATNERKQSLIMTIVAFIVPIFLGGLLIIPIALILGVAGFAIGDAIRQKKSKVYMLVSTTIYLLFILAIVYLVTVRLINIDVIEESFEMMRESMIRSIEMTKNFTQQQTITEEQLDKMFESMKVMIPASVILSCCLLAVIFLSINLPILKRFNVQVPKFAPFKEMRLPKAVLWYYLIILTIMLFVRPEEVTAFYVITLNFSVILWVLLTLQGISFLFFIIEEKKLPPMLKTLVAIFSIPFYSFVLLIGVFDLGFDIRNYVLKKK